jgi:hypothetical protein
MNNQEILDNAPDGATHFDGSYYYIVNEDAHKSSEIWNVVSPYKWHESGNLRLNDLIDMRSLVDIKRIAELEAESVIPISVNQFEYAFYKVCEGDSFALYEWLGGWKHITRKAEGK